MADKPARLSKVARELNIGIQNIAEFLESKGIEVDPKPNTKIDGAAYGLLIQEFASDKESRAEAEQISSRTTEHETITLDNAAKKEAPANRGQETDEIFIKNLENTSEPVIKPKAPVTGTKVLGKIDLEPKKPVKKEEPKPEPKQPEPEVKEEKPAPVPEPEKAPEPKPEKKAVETITARASKASGPKVLGNIDVDAASKPKKKASKPAEPEQPVAEKPAAAPVEAAPELPKSKEPELVKAEAQKLTGPKLVGKIELPKVPEKKPVEKKDRKKRKRITGKVDIAKDSAKLRQQGGGGKKRTDNRRGGPKEELTEEEIQKQIRETLARLSNSQKKSKGSKHRRAKRDAVAEAREEQIQTEQQEQKVLKVTEFVTVNELATMMGVSVNDVISACMSLGMMVSINQRLDAETLTIVAEEFDYEVEFVSEGLDEATLVEEDTEGNMMDRPPIVTVMGHVDHGKTSLLDHIREENVIAGEAGGITQHIGAYSVETKGGQRITFLDTPGHEAFTAMRARGAQVTDIAIIVIAADDSVMPQTKEAINHAQAAGVPMVFAFNKIDRDGANADKIREELSQMNILVEDWGGKFQSQEVSAKTGLIVDELLEKVILEAELLELKADADKRPHGTVIESLLDKGRGYVTTILVEGGTLKVGDFILVGEHYGKVKAMQNERGGLVEEAPPATPVSILGLNGAPAAGEKFVVMEDEREAKEIATKRGQLQREQGIRTTKHITLDEIGRRLAIGEFQELNIIVKGDVDGSIEALSDSLLKLSTEKIQVNIIHKSVGQISDSDVLLATASDAIIVGFQVRPSASARKLAEVEEIDIRLYSVIYDAIDEVKSAMQGMLKPTVEEKITATVEIRETFKISKVGTIAGCYVTDGKVNRNHKVRLIRDGIVVYAGKLGSLKRFKDDVKEVASGYECGLNIENFNDIKVGDIVEAFEEVEVAQTL